MQNSLKLFLIILISVLIVTGCSEDSPSEPEINNNQILSSKTIGSEGGILETEILEVSIPSGALENTANLSITTSAEENLFSANKISEFYLIEGLPLKINKPIRLKIKYNGLLTDSSFIAIGENNFTSSLNDNLTSFRLLNAKDSSGYLIADLSTLTETSSDNTHLLKTNDDNITLNIGAISGYASYLSSQGHFKINFPSSVINEAFDLGDYLENAYNTFKNLGFEYSRRTKWPVEVTVKKLESSVFGYSYNSVWGDNYGYMEFNVDKITNKEELKVTAGHEFFHLVQSLYDPRNRFSKAKFQSDHLWLDEASSVWSEYLFSSSGSNFVSPIFANNAFEILNGIESSTGANAQSYGYGMASLIKFITTKYGSNSLVKIYEKIYQGNSVETAVSSVFPISIDFSWRSYLKSLFSFELYNGDSFKPATLLSTAKIKSQNFIIKDNADSLKTFTSSLSDLSATIFSIKNEYTKLNNNAKLEIICDGWDLQVYKINSSESNLISSGKDTLEVTDFKKITDAGYQIALVLFNDDLDLPYDSRKDYQLEIKVKAPKTIRFINFTVNYLGTFEFKTSESTTLQEYDTGMSDLVWNRNSQISGNTITLTQDSTDIYNRTITTLAISFDDIENPTNIVNFSFHKVEKSVDYNVERTYSAAGSSVPFELSDYSISGTIYRYTGNISQYLSNLYHQNIQITNDNSTISTKLISYKDSGKIQIIVDYE